MYHTWDETRVALVIIKCTDHYSKHNSGFCIVLFISSRYKCTFIHTIVTDRDHGLQNKRPKGP